MSEPEPHSNTDARHLQVEKSLQRIQNGQRNSMYTSQQSVENKVGGVPGWQALLTAVGFRLDSAGPGIPAAVFFPTADPGDRLQQCSTTLQSLLGMHLRPALYRRLGASSNYLAVVYFMGVCFNIVSTCSLVCPL